MCLLCNGMTEKSETKRNSNKGRLRMVALSETFPAINVWRATSELVVLDHRQQLCCDLKEEWLWIRPNLWLPKTLMHWFLGTQSSALVSSSWRGGVVLFNWDTGGPPRSKSCNTPKTYTNNTKSHTQNIVSVPDILSTALINASMKYMFIQQMGEK